jgi:hypothetical protein
VKARAAGSGYRSVQTGTPEPVDPCDEITRPDLSDLLVIRMAEIFGNLKAHERAHAIQLITDWAKCSADRRACIEFSARELAKVSPEVV